MSIYLRLNPLKAALLLALGAPAQAATFDVNSCDATALINAIDTANDNGQADVINLNGDCSYTLTAINNETDGNNGLPAITSTVTINGNGATIERSSAPYTPAFRLMHIAASGDLVLDQVTIQNGWAIDSISNSLEDESGGGLLNQGKVTLTNSTLTSNTANYGGGSFFNRGKVTLTNSTLTDNSASAGGGFNSRRGFSATRVALINSNLTNNLAYDGGGFINVGGGAVTLINSTLTANSAVASAIYDHIGRGGGFWNDGTITLINSTLSDNSAHLHGGGFHNTDSGIATEPLVELNNSSLFNNSAGQNGGGFYNQAIGTVTLTNSTLSGNSAYSWGGGFFNGSYATVMVTNSTLSGNSASTGGGFGNFSAGKVTLTNSTLSSNSASNYGGGFRNFNNSNYLISLPEVTVTNSTLFGSGAAVGGGLYSGGSGEVVTRLTNTLISDSIGDNCAGDSLVTDISNLFDDPTCNGIATATINLDFNLADNGGPTLTHALLPGSTAINAGIDCAGPPVKGVDQRGFGRDAFCDIGAFEFNGQPPTAKIGVQRGGQWFLDRNGNGQWDGCDVDGCLIFGAPGDQPVAGDWDGDGLTEIGVLRNGQWFLDNGNGQWDGCDVDGCLIFGAPGDQPVAGDWDGDGLTEIGVLRNGQWFLDNGNGQWDGCGALPLQDTCLTFGAPGDKPIAGDWNGDGVADIGVQRGSDWFLDNGNGQWDGCGTLPAQDGCISGFGIPTDQPVTGDWNGDGFAGIGVKRIRHWFLDRNANDAWDGCNIDSCVFGWGVSGDIPISGRWK